MFRSLFRAVLILAVVAAALAAIPAFWPSLIWQAPAAPGISPAPDAKRGEYVFLMAGCASCHTAKGGNALAGGRKLKTPFGVFVAPNITPDPGTGLGRWSERDFFRAMTIGLSPDGRHYYPAFPYTSYTRMTAGDLRDLWAYLKTVPAVNRANEAHDLDFPYSIRPGIGLWKLLFLDTGTFRPVAKKSKSENRGAYIVTGPGHCGECHTPRNFMGGLRTSQALAGTRSGPEGDPVPNITPHGDKGIGKWSKDDILFALQTGLTPSGDVVGGSMAEVVENGTAKLTAEDRAAIADYLRSLPPRSGQ